MSLSTSIAAGTLLGAVAAFAVYTATAHVSPLCPRLKDSHQPESGWASSPRPSSSSRLASRSAFRAY